MTPSQIGIASKAGENNVEDNKPKPITVIAGSSAVFNVFLMAIFYAIQAGLSLIVGVGMMFFSKYLPTEIPKLNICIRLFGGIIRFFMNI